MKRFLKVFIVVFLFVLALTLCACGDKNDQPDDPAPSGETQTPSGNETQTPGHDHSYGEGVVTTEATYNREGVKTYTCSCGATRTETVPALVPTAAQAAAGRQAVVEETLDQYDFSLKLTGNVKVYGANVNAAANYDGKYRYNKQTSDLQFYRETSGNLLLNAKEYIFTQGTSRLKVTANKNDVTKKITITPKEDDELNMINLPFVKIVNALNEGSLVNVKRDTTNPKYRFSANMQVSTNIGLVNNLLGKVARLGSNVSFKGVTMDNPQGGVKLFFNLTDDGKLYDFYYDFDVSFNVAGFPVKLTLAYAQNRATSAIATPSLTGVESDSAAIAAKLADVSSAVAAIRNASAYSLDLTAINNLDAGWNKAAVVDKYTARMYKNTNGDRVDFNHSYVYKAHTEEEGKEAFKYTVGNIQDGSVYEISRKGSNQQTLLEGVTVDSRFNLLASFASLNASDVDFLKTTRNSDGSTSYEVYMKDSATASLQDRIADLINSNAGEGVIPVENYFNEDSYSVAGCSYVVTIKSGKLVSLKTETDLRYAPTGGEYTDGVVTLKNSVELTVNAKLDKAQEYTAPKNVETKLGSYGLNNAKYYIL